MGIMLIVAVGAAAIGFASHGAYIAICRDRAVIRAMRTRLARSKKLYAQSMAATTDAERGRIIDELVKE